MFDSNIIWVSYYERNLNVKAAFSFGVIEWGPIWGGSLKPSSGSLGDWLLLGNWVLANQPVTTVPAQPNHHIFDRLPFQHIKRNACRRIKRILLGIFGRGLSKKVKVKIWMDYPNIFCKSCSWINLREACRCNSMQEWSFTKTRTALNEWKGSWSVDALICRDKWKLTPVKVKIDGRSWSVDTLIDLPAPVICERKSEIWWKNLCSGCFDLSVITVGESFLDMRKWYLSYSHHNHLSG